MDYEEKVEGFSIIMEVAGAVFSVSLSIALGLLVAPWCGFMAFSAFVLLFIIVMMASFSKAKREHDMEGDGDNGVR